MPNETVTPAGLKPCPFCGGEARIETVNHDYGVIYSVGCFGSGRCGAGFTVFDHRNYAIATWNRRTLSTITPAEVGGLVERLRERAESYRMGGPSSEHTAALLDEAATALSTERAAHAETKRERDEHKRLKNDLVLKAYPAMDGADDLIEALGRYGFPVSDAAEPALMEGGSREAQALHKAAKAFIAARRVLEGGE